MRCSFILVMKILICFVGRTLYLKVLFASVVEPIQSVLILDLQLVYSFYSLEEPFVIGRCGPSVQGPVVRAVLWVVTGYDPFQ